MALNTSGFGLNYDQGFRPMGQGGGSFGGGGGGGGSGFSGPNPTFMQTWQHGDTQSALDRALQSSLAAGGVAGELARQRLQNQGSFRTTQLENTGATQRANIAAQAAEYAPKLQQERFSTLYNNLSGQQQPFAQTLAQVGGQATPAPQITVAPVYSDQQIQSKVNQTTANNDQATQGKINDSQSQLAGRGFGGDSPLAQSLAAMYQGQNLQSNTQNETDLRFNAAQANSQQILQGQQARSQQWSDQNANDVARRQTAAGYQNQLQAALSRLM